MPISNADRRTALRWLTLGSLASMTGCEAIADARIHAVGLFVDLEQAEIPLHAKLIRTIGHSVEGVGAALYRRLEDSGAEKSAYRAIDASGGQWELAEENITPQMCGPVGSKDDHPTFLLWAAAVAALDKEWEIPAGDYILDGNTEIVLTKGGACFGSIAIPRGNRGCRFVFDRDEPGVRINASRWGKLNRGTKSAAVGRIGLSNLLLESSEILIERSGGAAEPYHRQEFIRANEDGSFSTPTVCGYEDNSQMTVTAFSPSKPIVVRGLKIRSTGTSPRQAEPRGLLVCRRDSVVFEDIHVINEDATRPLSVAVETSYCADVTFVRPRISGANDIDGGLGYGIVLATTIGCRIIDPLILDCREAVSGRHNGDVHIKGGKCSFSIDDHWGNRMMIEQTTIICAKGGAAIQFAGNDISVQSVRQINGRCFLAIREDTPNLGGAVHIRKPSIMTRGEEGDYYLFALSSPNGPNFQFKAVSNGINLPDTVTIDRGIVDTDTPVTWIAYLASLETPHLNWGRITLRGDWRLFGDGVRVGVMLFKDGRYQTGRHTEIFVDGPFDFGAGTAVYVTSNDASSVGAARVHVEGIASGNLRYSPNSVESAIVIKGRLGSVENDNPSERIPHSCSKFFGVEMTGGKLQAVSEKMLFENCLFTGGYSSFPPLSSTKLRNVRRRAAANIPLDFIPHIVVE